MDFLSILGVIALFTIMMLIKGGMTGKYAVIEGAYFSGLYLAAFVNPIFGLFWALANRPAMSDPAGDWKRSLQRGVFTGACLTLSTGIIHLIDPYFAINVWYILAGATMPLCYRLGLKWYPKSWILGEALYGAAFGLAATL